jgi:hypothetical protein
MCIFMLELHSSSRETEVYLQTAISTNRSGGDPEIVLQRTFHTSKALLQIQCVWKVAVHLGYGT